MTADNENQPDRPATYLLEGAQREAAERLMSIGQQYRARLEEIQSRAQATQEKVQAEAQAEFESMLKEGQDAMFEQWKTVVAPYDEIDAEQTWQTGAWVVDDQYSAHDAVYLRQLMTAQQEQLQALAGAPTSGNA